MTPHSRSARPTPPSPRGSHLRLVAPPPLRVVDVAPSHGERSGAIRTYVDAKRRALAGRTDVEHHVIAAANGCRLPLGVRDLKATLRRLRPDVVLLHDPFWSVLGVTDLAHQLGACVVAVHHGSCSPDAAGFPGPDAAWRPPLRAWFRHAYREVDAVMSAIDPLADSGRRATLPLRFGVDPAFRPRPDVPRRDHVLYAGRLSREQGLGALLEAAAISAEPWRVEIVGGGTYADALEERARRLGLELRVSFHPFERSREALARRYAEASCVVLPGPFETFGLVGLEAAATGTRVVASATAPTVERVGGLVHTFAPGDARGLLRAIEAARATPRDLAAAADLAARSTWSAAFDAELADLRALLTAGSAPAPSSARSSGC